MVPDAGPPVETPDPDAGSAPLDGGADAGGPVDCLEIDMQPAAPYPSAAVRTAFVLRHCDGRPFTEPLDSTSISIINDETKLPFNASLEGGGAVAPRLTELSDEPAVAPTLGLYAVLTLDLSNSVVRSGALPEVLDAAQAFVDAVVRDAPAAYRYQVALWAFGSREQTQRIQDFTTDHAALSTSIDALRTSEGLGTTDLYGAYTSSLAHLTEKSGTADIVDQMLVIVTDGKHEAGDFDNARAAALQARDRAHRRGIEVFSVAVASPADDEQFLRELATSSSHFDAAETIDQVRDAFVRASQNLLDLPKATYVVGVCTPVELGDASLTVAVDYRGARASATARYGTSTLNGDVSSCDPVEVVNPCLRIGCGDARLRGFFCGECGKGSCANQEGDTLASGAIWDLDDVVSCQCAEGLTLCTDRCETLRNGSACGSCDNICPVACDGETSCVKPTSVSLSIGGSCATMSDRTTRCWGPTRPFDGTRQTPSLGFDKAVPALSGAVQIKLRQESGFRTGCTLSDSGVLMCFGAYPGNGTPDSDAPVVVPNLGVVRDFALGHYHTCAALSDGTVKCWGRASSLGVEPGSCTYRFTEEQLSPVEMPDLTNVVQLAADRSGTCALSSDGTIRCWNDEARRIGSPEGCSPRTLEVADVKQLAAGTSHMCAVTNDQSLYCWGWNSYGSLGTADEGIRHEPSKVPLDHVVHVAAYGLATCAVTAEKETYCWGVVNRGNSAASSTLRSPTLIPGATGAVSVNVGVDLGCILNEAGNLSCWGKAELTGRPGSGFLPVGPVDW